MRGATFIAEVRARPRLETTQSPGRSQGENTQECAGMTGLWIPGCDSDCTPPRRPLPPLSAPPQVRVWNCGEAAACLAVGTGHVAAVSAVALSRRIQSGGFRSSGSGAEGSGLRVPERAVAVALSRWIQSGGETEADDRGERF